MPRHQSVDEFALALRAIGEPQHGRKVSDISMAKVLGQLFATTELFEMQARPELVLLQKSMVLVEGVSRSLDPDLDIWTVSEPVVGDFVRREAGPIGRLEDFAERLREGAQAMGRVPALVEKAEAALDDFRAEQRRPRPVWWIWVAGFVGLLLLIRLMA